MQDMLPARDAKAGRRRETESEGGGMRARHKQSAWPFDQAPCFGNGRNLLFGSSSFPRLRPVYQWATFLPSALYHIGNSLARMSFLVPRAGLEPATTNLVGMCSLRLNYRGIGRPRSGEGNTHNMLIRQFRPQADSLPASWCGAPVELATAK